MIKVLLPVLAVVAAGSVWFSVQDASAATLEQRALDLADSRPTHSILMIGNSRTYSHDMPAMVRKIADSGGCPEKLEIENSSYGGASFESQWSTGRTRRLLGERWDDVVLQAESRAQWSDDLNRSFLKYGALLAKAAHPASGRARLILNWTYDPSQFGDDPDGLGRAAYREAIATSYHQLAGVADLHLINVASMWEEVRRRHPRIRLTEDGNHPTMAGSYLLALAIYADLYGRAAIDRVTFVPAGVSAKDAADIRASVSDFT